MKFLLAIVATLIAEASAMLALVVWIFHNDEMNVAFTTSAIVVLVVLGGGGLLARAAVKASTKGVALAVGVAIGAVGATVVFMAVGGVLVPAVWWGGLAALLFAIPFAAVFGYGRFVAASVVAATSAADSTRSSRPRRRSLRAWAVDKLERLTHWLGITENKDIDTEDEPALPAGRPNTSTTTRVNTDSNPAPASSVVTPADWMPIGGDPDEPTPVSTPTSPAQHPTNNP